MITLEKAAEIIYALRENVDCKNQDKASDLFMFFADYFNLSAKDPNGSLIMFAEMCGYPIATAVICVS